MIDDLLQNLPVKAHRTVSIAKGDVLFRQGQQTSGMYSVVQGCVTLQRVGLSGDTLTLHKAVAGGTFAEASIFSDVYHCDAICTQAGEVLKIDKTEVTRLMEINTTFRNAFTKHLAVQVQHYRAHIELLAIHSAKHRVFAAVQGGYFDGTVTALASRINLTPEACYRALRTLCVEGLLVQTGRGQYELS